MLDATEGDGVAGALSLGLVAPRPPALLGRHACPPLTIGYLTPRCLLSTRFACTLAPAFGAWLRAPGRLHLLNAFGNEFSEVEHAQ